VPLTKGQLLYDRYRIDALLAQGGMGAVYDGFDTRLNVRCAIKENLLFTEASTRQFEREAKILAALRHPNLPRVTDHFLISGQGQYLVMDFVEGEDLNQRLKRLGPQPEVDVLRWADDVLNALAYLHKRNIIHRDIKPNNIKITPDGEAVLVDFGIAKEMVDETGAMTNTGARGLTPGFAPPEQYGAWSGRTDARSDIYAFGATLYVLLTGEAPADALSRMTKPEKYIPLARRPAKVSEVLAQTIDTALELEPENRFQSAEEMKTALRTPNAIAGPETPQPEPRSATIASDDTTTLGETARVSKPGRLPLPILGAGFVGVVALAGFAVFMAFGRGGASPVATNTAEATTERVATVAVQATNTAKVTDTAKPSNTPVPLTPTLTPSALPPTNTAEPTRTPVPPTATKAIPPTSTHTPVTIASPTPTQAIPVSTGTTTLITIVDVSVVERTPREIRLRIQYNTDGSSVSFDVYSPDYCPAAFNGKCAVHGSGGTSNLTGEFVLGVGVDSMFCSGGPFTTNNMVIKALAFKNGSSYIPNITSVQITHTWCTN